MSNPELTPRHVSVLPAEVLEALAPAPGQVFVDATIGAGGHARLLAERLGPNGRLIGLDLDAGMLDLARPRLAGLPVTLVQSSFDRLRQVLDELGLATVDGVLADLGVCSDQLDDPRRGLSFNQPGPLDMRLDPTEGEPASDLLRRLNERDLADLIYRYGDERFSRRIARRIVEERRRAPLETTEQLAELVRRCVPRPPRTKGRRRPLIDSATRTFQALRIAVNDEMQALERLLAALPGCVRPGGRAALISFHSLEDRQVKQAFRVKDTWEPLTRKPIEAGEDETNHNPRARSAKLRAARRLGEDPEETTQDGERQSGGARAFRSGGARSSRRRAEGPDASQERSTDESEDPIRMDDAGRADLPVRRGPGLQGARRQQGGGPDGAAVFRATLLEGGLRGAGPGADAAGLQG
jgi:16S rRNA (cytosine1402-N4)-methyltransferase